MAEQTAQAPKASAFFPGDLVQVTDPKHEWHGVVGMVVATPSWGLQLEQHQPRGTVAANRAALDQIVLVGTAAILPPSVAAARRDAVATWQLVQAERAKA